MLGSAGVICAWVTVGLDLGIVNHSALHATFPHEARVRLLRSEGKIENEKLEQLKTICFRATQGRVSRPCCDTKEARRRNSGHSGSHAIPGCVSRPSAF
jgi:hypothetical protein